MVVRANNGRIDPERIEDYLEQGGYQTLHDSLHETQPAQVIEAIVKSGLRGRGGAGYPTGLKWGTVSKSVGAHKYVICNGDEGDPGAYMDRSVLESDPHRILEGMAIAGYADTVPVAQNDSLEGRARNRRVDLVILNNYALAKTEPAKPQPAK